jgi:hypothetical protein
MNPRGRVNALAVFKTAYLRFLTWAHIPAGWLLGADPARSSFRRRDRSAGWGLAARAELCVVADSG